MAPPKRKRLEKTVDTTPAPVSNQKFYCCRCGTAYGRQKGFFPVSHSPMYRGAGYLPICSDCIEELYEYYRTKLGDDRQAVRRICMKMDLYWHDSIYEMAERTAGVNSRVRNYIGKTNMIKYIDKSFDDTLAEEAMLGVEKKSDVFDFPIPEPDNNPEDDIQIEQEIIDFWGTGYSPLFYFELEKRYKDWTGEAPVNDPSERALYKQICLLEATITRDSAQGKAIDKNVNALNTLLGSMNLKPAQKKEDADAELEKMPLGVGIQKWEFSRPLPPTPDDRKDVRGTIKNITTWYLGHLCKMVGVKNSYCKMYEDAMNELRVNHPEYEDEDDDTMLTDLLGGDEL